MMLNFRGNNFSFLNSISALIQTFEYVHDFSLFLSTGFLIKFKKWSKSLSYYKKQKQLWLWSCTAKRICTEYVCEYGNVNVHPDQVNHSPFPKAVLTTATCVKTMCIVSEPYFQKYLLSIQADQVVFWQQQGKTVT